MIESNDSRGAQATLKAAPIRHPVFAGRPFAAIAIIIFVGYMALAIGLYF